MFVGVGCTENRKTQTLNMPTASGEGRRQNCRRPAHDWNSTTQSCASPEKKQVPLAAGKLRSVGGPPAPRLNRGRRSMPARLRLFASLPGFEPTYAAWPVWSDSTTKPVQFTPVPKKEAHRRYWLARQFDRVTKKGNGRQGGALGTPALKVL